MNEELIRRAYETAKEKFAAYGIDTDKSIASADSLPISIHAWQGDDLIGFDGIGELTGGIATTGNYPGRASTADELRSDIDAAFCMIPGIKRVSLHACHAEKDGKNVDRDAYTPEMFERWIEWAKDRGWALDFNPTFFSHPMMDGNFSLASRNENVRRFWVEHGKRCREIGEAFGKAFETQSIVNFWMPDGYKDSPADTAELRALMIKSLDEIMEIDVDRKYEMDAIESKLFGLGVESYTVASHEFSLLYALTRHIKYTLDAGHFHPTETISSKFSSILQFAEGLMLHVSRGVRWDSDHVVTYQDELQQIMNEIVFNGYENKVTIGLDYFDASINRLACWIIGGRNTRKAILNAYLMPIEPIKKAEKDGDFTMRLALLEEAKNLPYQDVWDYYVLSSGSLTGDQWPGKVKEYEKDVLLKRS